MRSDELHLAVALYIVTDGRNDEIDVAVGDQWDTGLGVHHNRHQADAKKVGDATGDIDFEAGECVALVAHREARIVAAQPHAQLFRAQDAHQHLGCLGAISRAGPRLVQHLLRCGHGGRLVRTSR